MRKVLGLLAAVIVSTMLASGCWDATDLGRTGIATAISFDLVREQDKVKPEDKVFLSILLPVLSPQTQERSRVLTAAGKTPGETRSERSNHAFRQITVSDLRSIVISEAMARQGVKDEMDILYRNPFLSYHVKMAIARGYAADIINLKPKWAPDIGQVLNNLLETIQQQNFVPSVTVIGFRCNLHGYGQNPVVPVIEEMTKEKDNIDIIGLAIFKKDRMLGMVDKEQMKFLTMLRGEKARGVITFPLKGVRDKYITLQGTNSRKVEVTFEDGSPKIKIDIFLITDIVETGGFMVGRELENYELVKKSAEDFIVSNCEGVISKLQLEYGVDATNAGTAARAKYGKAIEKQDWDTLFTMADVTIKANVKIRNHGAIK